MAQINLGSIKFNWKGSYSGATAYVVDDVVESSGSSYICILATTGNAPPNATYWEQMSSAGTNGTDGTDLGTTLTTQGDIVYRDASGLARLGAGTSGQALITNGAGANPSWGDVGGGLVQTVSATLTNYDSTTSTSFVDSSLLLNITPSSSSNKILIMTHFTCEPSTSNAFHANIKRTIGATATQLSTDNVGFVRQQDSGQQNNASIMHLDTPSTTSQIEYVVSFRSNAGGTVWFNGASNTANLIAMEVSV
jgi:hypothetical protein